MPVFQHVHYLFHRLQRRQSLYRVYDEARVMFDEFLHRVQVDKVSKHISNLFIVGKPCAIRS